MSKPKVVIIGAGAGGIACAKTLLKSSDFDVWLIDKTNHFLFKPFVTDLSTYSLSIKDIAIPIRNIFKKNSINIAMKKVSKIDKEEKKIFFEGCCCLTYDYLIFVSSYAIVAVY